jgi:hypothetical protein
MISLQLPFLFTPRSPNSHFFLNISERGSLRTDVTCTGDSGAGLTFERRGRWWLRGVVSQGVSKTVTVGGRSFNTCDLDYPTLFSDVFGHFEWIVQAISHKQFESSNKN